MRALVLLATTLALLAASAPALGASLTTAYPYKAGTGDTRLPCEDEGKRNDPWLGHGSRLDHYGGGCFGTGGYVRWFNVTIHDDALLPVGGAIKVTKGDVVLGYVEFCRRGTIDVPAEATRIVAYVFEARSLDVCPIGIPATRGALELTFGWPDRPEPDPCQFWCEG